MNYSNPVSVEERIFRIRNGQSGRITLVLEPWGREYEMLPEEELEVRETGSASDQLLEVEVQASRVLVHGRVGTILRVTQNGVELS